MTRQRRFINITQRCALAKFDAAAAFPFFRHTGCATRLLVLLCIEVTAAAAAAALSPLMLCQSEGLASGCADRDALHFATGQRLCGDVWLLSATTTTCCY